MRKQIIYTVGVISLITFFFTSCNKTIGYQYHSGTAEGTTFHIKYQYNKDLSRQIDSLLDHFENILSTYRDSSLISRFNYLQKDTFIFHNKLFAQMLNKAFEVYKNTNGSFDITVAPLVNAWGFGFDTLPQLDSMVIDSILQFVGMQKLSFVGDTMLIKQDKRIQIDGNAIAKGQSVDYISHYFDSLGIKNYLVEIGGELRTKGKNPKGEKWIIGIDKPIDGSTEWNRTIENRLYLSGKAIATSGNYRKFYIKNGKKYSHTINPHTGYTVSHNLLSASVITDDCITADAYATAFMVMGTNKTIEWLKNHKNLLEVLLIYNRGDKEHIWTSPEFNKRLIK